MKISQCRLGELSCLFVLSNKAAEWEIIMTIAYELKKILIKRSGLLLIFSALVLKIVLLIIAPNMTFINDKMEENKDYFLSYMEVLSGKLNEEKSGFITTEEQNFAQIESESETIMNAYTTGEISELEFIEYFDKYNSAQNKKKAFSVVQGQYQRALMNEKSQFMYNNGWSFLMGSGSPDWVLIILVLLLTAPVLCSEYTGEMAQLLDTTKKGKVRFYASKFIAVIIVTAITTVIFSLSEYIYAAAKYTLSHGDYPIQSIQQFASSEYDITILEGVLFIWFNRVFGICYMAAVVFFIICKIKKPLPGLFAGIGSVILPTLMFSKSAFLYLLPLPSAFLSSAGYLRSHFETSYMSETYITLSSSQYLRTLLIGAAAFIFLSVFIIFKIKVRKRKTIAVLCCIPLILTGCEENISTNENTIFNKHGSYEIAENSVYIFQNTDNKLIMTEKNSGKQTEIIREPFSHSNTTVLYNSIFADEKAFYRCEQIESSALNGNTIYTEQIVRTNLSDFSETVIYKDNILEDTNGAFLGLGEYLPSDIPEECSIRSFAVTDNVIYLEKTDGIYSCKVGTKKSKKLTDTAIITGEWAFTNECLYYVDELYRLHCSELLNSTDTILTDARVSGFLVTENEIYFRSLSDGGALMKMERNGSEPEIVVNKTGNCFSIDNNYVYYIDPSNGDVLCKLDIISGKTAMVSESACSFVYLISDCDYFYYRAVDTESSEYKLIKEER